MTCLQASRWISVLHHTVRLDFGIWNEKPMIWWIHCNRGLQINLDHQVFSNVHLNLGRQGFWIFCNTGTSDPGKSIVLSLLCDLPDETMSFANAPGTILIMSWLKGSHILLQKLFLLAAPILKPELNLGLRKAQPLSQLGLALVGDKAAALVLLLKLRPLIFGIPLEGACPP